MKNYDLITPPVKINLMVVPRMGDGIGVEMAINHEAKIERISLSLLSQMSG